MCCGQIRDAELVHQAFSYVQEQLFLNSSANGEGRGDGGGGGGIVWQDVFADMVADAVVALLGAGGGGARR